MGNKYFDSRNKIKQKSVESSIENRASGVASRVQDHNVVSDKNKSSLSKNTLSKK